MSFMKLYYSTTGFYNENFMLVLCGQLKMQNGGSCLFLNKVNMVGQVQ
uniref:Uncharacterized protein n=1 Tax=Arundo donax TaxID=35708 RepID=A0A0A9A0H0_ARUDO